MQRQQDKTKLENTEMGLNTTTTLCELRSRETHSLSIYSSLVIESGDIRRIALYDFELRNLLVVRFLCSYVAFFIITAVCLLYTFCV